MTPSVLAGHKDDKRRLLFSPACLASPAPLTRARSSVDARQRKITNTQIMSCVSATSAVARIAPTARLANKRAANVPPMRAARVNVVAAVDLNGASLLRSAGCEPVAVPARVSIRRISRSTRARGASARRSARASAPRSREVSWEKRSQLVGARPTWSFRKKNATVWRRRFFCAARPSRTAPSFRR